MAGVNLHCLLPFLRCLTRARPSDHDPSIPISLVPHNLPNPEFHVLWLTFTVASLTELLPSQAAESQHLENILNLTHRGS